jgi:hypothetical protein
MIEHHSAIQVPLRQRGNRNRPHTWRSHIQDSDCKEAIAALLFLISGMRKGLRHDRFQKITRPVIHHFQTCVRMLE